MLHTRARGRALTLSPLHTPNPDSLPPLPRPQEHSTRPGRTFSCQELNGDRRDTCSSLLTPSPSTFSFCRPAGRCPALALRRRARPGSTPSAAAPAAAGAAARTRVCAGLFTRRAPLPSSPSHMVFLAVQVNGALLRARAATARVPRPSRQRGGIGRGRHRPAGGPFVVWLCCVHVRARARRLLKACSHVPGYGCIY